VNGVNNVINAFMGPFNVTAEYIDRISNGNIPEPIVDEYKGDFNEIKNNLNQCIDAVSGLVAETVKLTEAAVAGNLDTRGKPDKFQGDFARIVQGINNTLDAVIGPLNVAAEYVERISNGDIPEPIIEEYKGDFNEIKNNLNQCIDAVNGLVAETVRLTEAAVEGRLDTRGNADNFSGEYARIVQGINNTLNAVIGPLNMAAEYVERISRGDVPEPITDEYKGDSNEIKNNLNQCIEAINGLVVETVRLTEAAVEGQLDTRGNADNFSGDYARIVQGINNTLDAVVEPLNVACDYIEQISTGDIPDRLTDEYKGKFDEIKNYVNTLIDSMNDINRLAEEMAAGNLTVEVKERSANDVLMQALNAMIQQLNGVGMDVKTAAGSVTSGSQSMSSGAEEMS
jgi:methyl-accepting chemotaxis protein